MRRDTIHIPSGGAVNIVFAADNPGVWTCEYLQLLGSLFHRSQLTLQCFQSFQRPLVHCHIGKIAPLRFQYLSLLDFLPSLPCDSEWHLEAGLAVTFVELPAEAQDYVQIPPAMYKHCRALNVPTSGVRSLFPVPEHSSHSIQALTSSSPTERRWTPQPSLGPLRTKSGHWTKSSVYVRVGGRSSPRSDEGTESF